jgi:hypothetical protein
MVSKYSIVTDNMGGGQESNAFYCNRKNLDMDIWKNILTAIFKESMATFFKSIFLKMFRII